MNSGTGVITTRDGFWSMVDREHEQASQHAISQLVLLERCGFESLRAALTEYRWFTLYYVRDLAYLIFRLPHGSLRSTMGTILAEELGNGDPRHEHPFTYDRFLLSLGVDDDEMDNSLSQENRQLLEWMRDQVIEAPVARAIGLRGMGGECLCQDQLKAFYGGFTANPEIQSRRPGLDWEFWDVHIGEVEEHHKVIMRAAIDEYLVAEPSSLPELSKGYLLARETFSRFWDNVLEGVKKNEQRRASLDRASVAAKFANDGTGRAGRATN